MRIREERGAALLLTVFFVVITLALGVALLTFALRSRETVTSRERQMQAYYIARSGADTVAQAIIDKKLTGFVSGAIAEGELEPGSFSVVIDKIGEGDSELLLTSTGQVGNTTQRISLKLVKNAVFMDDMAIFTNEDLNLNLPNLELLPEDTIVVGTNGENIYDTRDKLEDYQKLTELDLSFDSPKLPEKIDLTQVNTLDTREQEAPYIIDEDGYYDLIYIGPQDDLIIDTDILDDDIILVVDVFDLKGSLTIKGTNDVVIYVTEYVNIQTPNAIVEEDEASFTLIAMGTVTEFNLIANGIFEGNIYAPEVTISMHSNHTHLIGTIIADRLTGAGDQVMGKIEYRPPKDDWGDFDFIKHRRTLWTD